MPKTKLKHTKSARKPVNTNKMGILLRNMSMQQKVELSDILDISYMTLTRWAKNPGKIAASNHYPIVEYINNLYESDYSIEELIEPIKF